jgi:hypothetical protein
VAVRDLGAGVYEDDEPVANGRVGPAAPMDKLTCPACGLHDHADRIDHPDYPFFCSACSTLFTGTTLEFRRLRIQREAAIRRRENPPERLAPLRSRKTERQVPVRRRVGENDAE